MFGRGGGLTGVRGGGLAWALVKHPILEDLFHFCACVAFADGGCESFTRVLCHADPSDRPLSSPRCVFGHRCGEATRRRRFMVCDGVGGSVGRGLAREGFSRQCTLVEMYMHACSSSARDAGRRKRMKAAAGLGCDKSEWESEFHGWRLGALRSRPPRNPQFSVHALPISSS